MLLIQAVLLPEGNWLLYPLSLKLGCLVYSSALSGLWLSAEKWLAWWWWLLLPRTSFFIFVCRSDPLLHRAVGKRIKPECLGRLCSGGTRVRTCILAWFFLEVREGESFMTLGTWELLQKDFHLFWCLLLCSGTSRIISTILGGKKIEKFSLFTQWVCLSLRSLNYCSKKSTNSLSAILVHKVL